jgi:hypothetical protein
MLKEISQQREEMESHMEHLESFLEQQSQRFDEAHSLDRELGRFE